MELTISWDPLDEGIVKRQGVAPCWREIFGGKSPGHNCNSLDAIMARPRSDVTHERLERLGAKGARAVTVTFQDKILFRFKEMYLEHEIRKITKKQKGVIDFEFVGEYSDTGRFHLHGCVLVNDVKVLANLRRKYSKYGINKVKVIDDSVGWATYCLKNHGRKLAEDLSLTPGERDPPPTHAKRI